MSGEPGRTLSALAGLPLFSGGCPSDNMTPPKSRGLVGRPDPAVRVLQQGLDTLVLNYYGQLREDVVECLELAKEDAQASPTGEANSPLPPFDGVTPRMQERGAPYYEFRALSRDLTVTIARPSRSRRPAAVVRVSSECLWRMGDGGQVAAQLAGVYLVELFEGSCKVQVSRADLATDYQGHPPTSADRLGLVKRARTLREHFAADDDGVEWHTLNEEAQAFSAGRSSVLRVNCYDKTAEVKKRGKDWFFSLWERQKGYVSGEVVTRLEYQFGREFLHERQIETVGELLAGLAGLWAYAVEWFSYRTVNHADLRHRSRWPVAPWWLALSGWRAVEAEALPRVTVVRPGYRRLVQGFMGYLTSLMAVTGREGPGEALDDACRLLVAERGVAALDELLRMKRLRYSGFDMAAG